MMSKNNPEEIAPGDIYEDTFLHPCLCVGISDGFAWGISLIDGSQPRSCDLVMSGIRKLSLAEAWEMKLVFHPN
jgi:hypothetical protein